MSKLNPNYDCAPEDRYIGLPWGKIAVHTIVTGFWAALTFCVWVSEDSPAGVAMLTWLCFAGWVFCTYLVGKGFEEDGA